MDCSALIELRMGNENECAIVTDSHHRADAIGGVISHENAEIRELPLLSGEVP